MRLSSQWLCVSPPCWNLIYLRLPHEMTTSSMVCIRCGFTRLLVPQFMHTQALINTGPGETDFGPAKLGVRTCLVNGSQGADHVQTGTGLWWVYNQKLEREDDSGQSKLPGSLNKTPSLEPSSWRHSNTGKIHVAIMRKCHVQLLCKSWKIVFFLSWSCLAGCLLLTILHVALQTLNIRNMVSHSHEALRFSHTKLWKAWWESGWWEVHMSMADTLAAWREEAADTSACWWSAILWQQLRPFFSPNGLPWCKLTSNQAHLLLHPTPLVIAH